MSRIVLQPIKSRHHGAEYPDKQNGHVLYRVKGEVISLVNILASGKP